MANMQLINVVHWQSSHGSFSVSGTITASPNPVLVVLNAGRYSITSMTWNGVALTKFLDTSNGATQIEGLYLANPAVGTYTLASTQETGLGGVVAVAFNNAHPTNPILNTLTKLINDRDQDITYSNVPKDCGLLSWAGNRYPGTEINRDSSTSADFINLRAPTNNENFNSMYANGSSSVRTLTAAYNDTTQTDAASALVALNPAPSGSTSSIIWWFKRLLEKKKQLYHYPFPLPTLE